MSKVNTFANDDRWNDFDSRQEIYAEVMAQQLGDLSGLSDEEVVVERMAANRLVSNLYPHPACPGYETGCRAAIDHAGSLYATATQELRRRGWDINKLLNS